MFIMQEMYSQVLKISINLSLHTNVYEQCFMYHIVITHLTVCASIACQKNDSNFLSSTGNGRKHVNDKVNVFFYDCYSIFILINVTFAIMVTHQLVDFPKPYTEKNFCKVKTSDAVSKLSYIYNGRKVAKGIEWRCGKDEERKEEK